jgi:small subunit ribosomal protein S11
MARISGVDLPREKRVDIGLTYVYGIGRASALSILEKAGIDGAIRVKDLSEEHIVKIREIIQEGFQVEGDLRKTFSMNIKRLIVARTVGCAIGKGCPSAASGPRPMRGREKVAVPVWEVNQNRLRAQPRAWPLLE